MRFCLGLAYILPGRQQRGEPRPVGRAQRQERRGESLDGAGVRGFGVAGATGSATGTKRTPIF
jgi:hypothetical protein